MTKIKHFLRTIGQPNDALGIMAAEDVEAELEYKFLNQGWLLLKTDYLGAIRDKDGNEVGYRYMYFLTKEDNAKVK